MRVVDTAVVSTTGLERETGFRTDIQALRGLAVLLVVFYHGEVLVGHGGYLGVDVFFVISGYLITSIVARDINAGSFSFSRFYYRRAWRLLPAAYVVFALCILFSPFLLTGLEIRDLAEQVAGGVTFTANHVLWGQSGYFQQSADLKPLLHVWSLSLEEQYYLTLPLALYLVYKRYWFAAALFITFLSLWALLWFQEDMPGATFYLLPTRAWELGLGSVAALAPVLLSKRSLISSTPLGITLLVVLLIVPMSALTNQTYSGYPRILVCLVTILLIVGHYRFMQTTPLVRLLAWFGTISYSLYLVHWPVFAFLNNADVGVQGLSWGVRIGAIVISIILAYALYLFIERRFRITGSMTAVHPGWAAVLVVVGGLLVLGAMSVASGGEVREYANRFRPNVGLSGECDNTALLTGSAECRSAPEPGVLVWGDSFAMHLVPGIAVSSERGVAQSTKSVCPPLTDVALYAPPKYNDQWGDGCLNFNRRTLEALEVMDSVDIVVLAAQWSYLLDSSAIRTAYGTNHLDGRTAANMVSGALTRTIAEIRKRGKRVVIVSPPPYGGFNIARCIERREAGKWFFGAPEDCRVPLEYFTKKTLKTRHFLTDIERDANVQVYSFASRLCRRGECATTLEGRFLYRDEAHLSYEGSVAFAKKYELVKDLDRLAR